jgi:hypothetical protein
MMKFFKQLFGATRPSCSEPTTAAQSGGPQRKRENTGWGMRVALHGGDLEAKVEVMQMLVLDLLREVEALRRTQLDDAQANGICPKESRYGKIYRDTALLTHNSCGPTDGIAKLLNLWSQDLPATLGGGRLSEVVMLKRLGFSPAEIDRYVQEAEECESYT